MSRGALLTVLPMLLMGCVNTSQFQSAEVLRKGELRLGGGPSISAVRTNHLQEGEDPEYDIMVHGNGYIGYGVTENFEVHARAFSTAGGSAGFKSQVVGRDDHEVHEPGFDLSLGADVTYSLGGGRRNICLWRCNDELLEFVDVELPVFLGYRIDDTFALYLTPRYALRHRLDDGEFGHMLTAAIGLEVHRSNARFFFEFSGGHDFLSGSPSLSFAVGFGT